jgi:CheY-like chemotaxis protein
MFADPIRILIVDDDEDVLIELERMLEGEGYRTATAWSAREALVLAASNQFDLLLVDEHLADLDTKALCEELIRTQPGAFRFLMHTRKEGARKLPSTAHMAVCKWEHNELKASIRRCLAA